MKKKLRHSRIRRKNKKKGISFLTLLLLLLLAGEVAAWSFSTQFFLRPLTQKVFTWIQHRTEAKGIQTTVLEFEDVHWQYPDRIFWKNVSFRLHASSKGPFSEGIQGVFWAREIEIKFPKSLWGEFRAIVRGGSFAATPDQENRLEFFADQCRFVFRIPWWPLDKLRARLGEFFNEAYRILKDGKTKVPIQLSGRISFKIFGKQEESQVWIIKDGAEYRLVMNPNDLKRIAGAYDEKVADLEVELLARYPLWTPRALKITDQAKAVSSEAFKKDKNVPQDAFRHVWWSYHLTKAFGPEFSKEFTDAHEQGEPTREEADRTEADHIMDYRNNQVGIDCALQGCPEDSLLERTMKDPRVFRSIKEVYREMGVSESS